MKKLLALLLTAVLCLSLAACASTPKDTTPANTTKDNAADDSNASEPAAEGGKNIVWAGWSGEEEASKDIFQRMMKTYEAAVLAAVSLCVHSVAVFQGARKLLVC